MSPDIGSHMKEWISKELGCAAGRREFNKGRIKLNFISNEFDVLKAYTDFISLIHKKQAVACMFILNNAHQENISFTCTLDETRELAKIMSVLSEDRSAETLVNVGRLGKVFRTLCPVTNQIVDFDDFNFIAFSPHANDQNDPLYDPMMAAPYPCVNLTLR
jgi:hypothetical protein